jgi:hypothetical protein
MCGKRVSVWSAVTSAPLSSGRRILLFRKRIARAKAAVNTPHSKRFARVAAYDSRANVWKARTGGLKFLCCAAAI